MGLLSLLKQLLFLLVDPCRYKVKLPSYKICLYKKVMSVKMPFYRPSVSSRYGDYLNMKKFHDDLKLTTSSISKCFWITSPAV